MLFFSSEFERKSVTTVSQSYLSDAMHALRLCEMCTSHVASSFAYVYIEVLFAVSYAEHGRNGSDTIGAGS